MAEKLYKNKYTDKDIRAIEVWTNNLARAGQIEFVLEVYSDEIARDSGESETYSVMGRSLTQLIAEANKYYENCCHKGCVELNMYARVSQREDKCFCI